MGRNARTCRRVHRIRISARCAFTLSYLITPGGYGGERPFCSRGREGIFYTILVNNSGPLLYIADNATPARGARRSVVAFIVVAGGCAFSLPFLFSRSFWAFRHHCYPASAVQRRCLPCAFSCHLPLCGHNTTHGGQSLGRSGQGIKARGQGGQATDLISHLFYNLSL